MFSHFLSGSLIKLSLLAGLVSGLYANPLLSVCVAALLQLCYYRCRQLLHLGRVERRGQTAKLSLISLVFKAISTETLQSV